MSCFCLYPNDAGGGDRDQAVQALKIAGMQQSEGDVILGLEGEQGRMANKAFQEIVETEKSYVLDMVLLVTHYQRPCQGSKFLTEEQVMN